MTWRLNGTPSHFIIAILSIGFMLNLYLEISRVIRYIKSKRLSNKTKGIKAEIQEKIRKNGNDFETILTMKLIESQERAKEIIDIFARDEQPMSEQSMAKYLVEFGSIQGFNDGIEWTMELLAKEQEKANIYSK